MTLDEFRQRVTTAFGTGLEHATPANVRDFIDSLQQESWDEQRGRQFRETGQTDIRLDIPGSIETSYEATIRRFFRHMLETDRDQSLIMLWLFALDLAYSGIADLHSADFDPLFRDTVL